MTAAYLQDALAQEIRTLFDGERFENDAGERVPLAVYLQDLPELAANEDETGRYPCCIVRVTDGTAEDFESAHTVNVVLVFGVVDHDRARTGYRTVMHLIDKVYQRFAARRQLGQYYICRFPMRWQLQDVDTYPYFVGGMQLAFDAPAIQIEDPYA